jgi:hypothetical protein
MLRIMRVVINMIVYMWVMDVFFIFLGIVIDIIISH